MKELQIFKHDQFGDLRFHRDEDGVLWFCASDITTALDYTSTNRSHIFSLVPDEWKARKIFATPGGPQEMNALTEQGLYFFLGRSDKPKALPYQKWVAGEVVPSVRRHGGYLTPEKVEEAILNPDFIIKLATELKQERAERELLANRQITLLAENKILSIERDQAIRTKAWISSSREAKALARASAETRRANALKARLGLAEDYMTVKAIAWLPKVFDVKRKGFYSQIGKELGKFSKLNGFPVEEVRDERFGKVKTYFKSAVEAFLDELGENRAILEKYRLPAKARAGQAV